MNLFTPMTIMAQLTNGQVFNHGTEQFETQILSVNPKLGLIAMALGDDLSNNAPAPKSVEILLDDIELNLAANEERVTPLVSESLATLCLRESVDNINEYLFSTLDQSQTQNSGKGIGLAAMLLLNNQLSCFTTSDICCFLFKDNQLSHLIEPPDPDSAKQIGVDKAIQPQIVAREFYPGDILIMISAQDLNVLGLDFIRVTLSRFEDNLEMALRQITIRMHRNGLEQDPALILCCIKPVDNEK